MTDLVQCLRSFTSGPHADIARDAADEIERLRAEVDRLRAGGCARDQKTTQWCAEAEALRADAERYRWLRGQFRVFSLDMGGQHFYCLNGTMRARGPNLDAAIDAARKA